MSDHHRKLLQSLGGELVALVRSQVARDARERAAGARRWEQLRERSERPTKEGFREDLHGVLEGAVQRLEQLQREVERRESRGGRAQRLANAAATPSAHHAAHDHTHRSQTHPPRDLGGG